MTIMAMLMMMIRPHSSSALSSDAPSRCCTCYIARKVQGHCADLIVIVIMVLVNLIFTIMFNVFIRESMVVMMRMRISIMWPFC